MSRSPDSTRGRQGLDGYVAGWEAIFRLLREGRSWSGFERNCAFLNLGDGRFATASGLSGLDHPDDGRGLATTDWDQDGDVDVWLANRSGPRLRLLRNRLGAGRPWVTFRLEGTSSNRDAVGARVEVDTDDGRTLVQTLYAGDGYLSQSSKELHFGLGDGDGDGDVDAVRVVWPGGRRENFGDVAPRRRHRLVEGEGRASRVDASRPATALEAQEQVAHRSTSTARVFLPVRMPMPRMQAAALGDSVPSLEPTGQPLLVNFWASWCLPCVGELEELSERETELEARALRVVALSVDGLGAEATTGPADARHLLDRIDSGLETGMATTDLLEKIELLEEVVYDRKWPFSIPVSFLVDGKGHLAAVYRGRINVDELLADLGALDGDPLELHGRSAALPGRWVGRLPEVDLLWLGRKFRTRFPEDMETYLLAALDQQETYRGVRADSLTDAAGIDRKEGAILLDLAEISHTRGDRPLAIERLEQAISRDPSNERARNNLAQVLRDEGRNREAAVVYRSTLERSPDDSEASYGLGMTLWQTGELNESFFHLERAAELSPESAAPLHAMAWMILTYASDDPSQVDEAVGLAERGARLTDHRDPLVLDALAAAYAADGRFERALETADEALTLAALAGDGKLEREIRSRIVVYRQGRPWTEPAPP